MLVGTGRRISLLRVWERDRGLCPTSAPGTGPARADDMLLFPSAWAHEKGLSTKTRIPKLWDSAVPVINGTGADIVCFFSPSAGHKDQYQFQGAAQVPSAT